MPETGLDEIHSAFQNVQDEIRQEGSEFDFRYSLVDHLFTDALGWSRTEGEGHVNFEDDRKDLLFFDDSEPPFPVAVCETKRPSHDLNLDDVEQLEAYLNGVGSARYGILTNGHEFRLYEYLPEERSVRGIADFDIDKIAGLEIADLTEKHERALLELEYLRRDRYVDLGDAEHFRETYQEVPVRYDPGTDDEGYELFLDAVKGSLDELTDVLERFFEDYRSREENSYPREFLESTFPDWQEWREYTGKTEHAEEAFCRETAYIILNRTLFARIAEDKEIVGHTRLSSRGMASALEADGDSPFLDALLDTYDQIDDHYPDLYELGIFDWWWVSKDNRGQFSKDERRRQNDLESDLDYTLGRTLKRLNRFDFGRVNRDILGHVYEDYLPKQERKELGEYYTPIEVVQFMLDSVGYRPDEGIGRKKVLDPACGSGTFLTEITERLIQHFVRKFNLEGAYQFDPDQARTVLERVEENVYGIDINPFAAHITQINLLFRTIDLYDAVTEKDPNYTMEGFEIHVADTLSPTLREKQSKGIQTKDDQLSLERFADYNGRARSFVRERDTVDSLKNQKKFDLIVANPPYVSTQNMSTEAKSEYIEYYEDIESESTDIYVPFIERGYNWLSDDGEMTYICPDRLLTTEYAELSRESLVEYDLTHLIQFKETEVFDVSTPYPVIFTLQKENPSDESGIKCARFAEEKDGILDEITHLEDWEAESEAYDLFYYEQSQLRNDNRDEFLHSWKPMPDREKKVFKKIERNSDGRLKNITEAIFQGIITGRDNIFIGEIVEELENGLVRFRPSGHHKEHIIDETVLEGAILKRILKGPDIGRWDADWRGIWAIFPYDESGNSLTESSLKQNYPETWEYFENHQDTLKGRRTSNWWDYSRKQNISKIQKSKLIVRVNSNQPTITLDNDGRYIFVGSGGGSGGYGMLISPDAGQSNHLLAYGALLMSRVTEFYVEHISAIFGDKYYQYNERFLNPIPIVSDDKIESADVPKLAEEIVRVERELTELRYAISDIRNYLPNFQQDLSILDLASQVSLTGDDYRQGPIRTNDKMEVDTERVYQIVLKQGHSLDFGDERTRDFVFELLTAQDKRLGRSEILDMSVPEKEDVQTLMEEYEGDQERIETLELEAEELQSELDDVVQREAYMLNDGDIDVIDDFLEVW